MRWQPDIPPHIHAAYGKSSVVVTIEDLAVYDGQLPHKQMLILLGWSALRQDQLMDCWSLISQGFDPFSIEPIR